MKIKQISLCLAVFLSGTFLVFSADGSFDNLTATGITALEGPVQIDDTSNASTAGQWNLTLENGLFIWGDPANSFSLNLDFSSGETLMFWYPHQSAFRVGETSADSHDEANIGELSTAWGRNNQASGQLSTAWGDSNTASSEYSTAWGAFNVANAYYGSTAWGEFNTASGYVSTAFGGWVTTSGAYATAWGYQNNAGGNYSSTWGLGNSASGQTSTAWGRFTQSESYLNTALGQYNIGGFDAANGGGTTWFDHDPLLEVGIGTSATRANALTVLKDGRMALGYHDTLADLQSNPETLQVGGSVLLGDDGDTATLGAIRYGPNGFEGYDGTWKTFTAYGDGAAPTHMEAPDGSADLTVESDGYIRIGTSTPVTLLDVNGDANFSGEVNIESVPAKGGISMGVYQ
jgi:hypothetical protein